MAGGVDSNCKIESEVTVLPEPDSPTIATISPLLTSREMFCMAVVVSDAVLKSTERFFM